MSLNTFFRVVTLIFHYFWDLDDGLQQIIIALTQSISILFAYWVKYYVDPPDV